MDIVIDPTGVPTMQAADDFTSLRLTGTAPSSPEARATLAGWGIELTADGTHGHIAHPVFASLAGAPAADRPAWQQGLRGMLDFAANGQGLGGRRRAHPCPHRVGRLTSGSPCRPRRPARGER